MRSIALYGYAIDSKTQKYDSLGNQTQETNVSESEFQDYFKENLLEELHINIWKVQEPLISKPKVYIDFGIMTTFKTKKMYLYLPFRIVGHPIDLGKKLQKNREMLCTVFNDNLMSETYEKDIIIDKA